MQHLQICNSSIMINIIFNVFFSSDGPVGIKILILITANERKNTHVCARVCWRCLCFSGLGEGRRKREGESERVRKKCLKSERVWVGYVYNRNAGSAGAHTWRTRKCAAVLRPDENPSQGAARMRRVSFAMFRLFQIVFLCVTLLHPYYRILQRRARVNHMVTIYRSHAWHHGRRRCSSSIRLLWHMYIIYLYTYTCVRKLCLVTMVGYIGDKKKKKSEISKNAVYPLHPGIGFRCYTGVAAVYSGRTRSDHQKRNMLVSTVFGTST
jgi:hypothetical protein